MRVDVRKAGPAVGHGERLLHLLRDPAVQPSPLRLRHHLRIQLQPQLPVPGLGGQELRHVQLPLGAGARGMEHEVGQVPGRVPIRPEPVFGAFRPQETRVAGLVPPHQRREHGAEGHPGLVHTVEDLLLRGGRQPAQLSLGPPPRLRLPGPLLRPLQRPQGPVAERHGARGRATPALRTAHVHPPFPPPAAPSPAAASISGERRVAAADAQIWGSAPSGVAERGEGREGAAPAVPAANRTPRPTPGSPRGYPHPPRSAPLPHVPSRIGLGARGAGPGAWPRSGPPPGRGPAGRGPGGAGGRRRQLRCQRRGSRRGPRRRSARPPGGGRRGRCGPGRGAARRARWGRGGRRTTCGW